MFCIREDSVLGFSFFFFFSLDNVSAQKFLPGPFCWVAHFASRNAKSLPDQICLLESLKVGIWSIIKCNSLAFSFLPRVLMLTAAWFLSSVLQADSPLLDQSSSPYPILHPMYTQAIRPMWVPGSVPTEAGFLERALTTTQHFPLLTPQSPGFFPTPWGLGSTWGLLGQSRWLGPCSDA